MNTLLVEGALFFNKSKKTFIYLSLIVFTLVLEEVFQKVVFRCPCHYHFYYGLLFLLGPSMFLFMLGILLNGNTWKLLKMFRRQRLDEESHDTRHKCLQVSRIVGEILFKALLSPLVWLVLSFLQKKFYVCAVFGPVAGEIKKMAIPPCNKATKNPFSEAQLMAFSQMWGLLLLIISTFVVFVAFFIGQCCGNNKKNLRLAKSMFYKRIEAKAAAKEFHRIAKQEAQNRGTKTTENILDNLRKRNNEHDYLVILSEAGAKLDYQYSKYYTDSQLTDNQRQAGQPEQQRDGCQSPECIFTEDIFIDSYLAVDGVDVHFDSELKVVQNDGRCTSCRKWADLSARQNINMKKQYNFKRSQSLNC